MTLTKIKLQKMQKLKVIKIEKVNKNLSLTNMNSFPFEANQLPKSKN
jgi:hypothetical protein